MPTLYPAAQFNIKQSDLCQDGIRICRTLTDAGYAAYFVGGCVRDLILNKHPKDFDLVTNASPEQINAVISNSRIIGRRFKLVHVHFGRRYLEVATFRAAKNEDTQVSDEGRIISDNTYGSMEEDAFRRDFTINALYYNPVDDSIIDYVGAIEDIQAKRVRFIGDAYARYREDPVRLLRALRFKAKLGLSFDDDVAEHLSATVPLLEDIAPARLFDETIKLLHCGNAVEGYRLMNEHGINDVLFPQLNQLSKAQLKAHNAFIEAACSNTDKRLAEDKSVMPAFLLAVILWPVLMTRQQHYLNEGQPPYQAMQLAATDIMNKQIRSTAMPRFISNTVREVWVLQMRFIKKNFARVSKLLEQKRFRAAFDFMCLRAQHGELPESEILWWEGIQQVDKSIRRKQCTNALKRRDEHGSEQFGYHYSGAPPADDA